MIREELGEDTTISDAEEFAQKAEALDAPDEVKEKLKKEISRFKNSMQSPAEAGVIRTYIETMLENVANYYEDDVQVATEQVMALMEPMIIVVMAIVVGVLIMAIMQPMLTLYESIG